MIFKKENGDEVMSLLAEGVELSGDLSFSQSLRVDGIIRGTVTSDSSLIIGPKGRVEAEVRVRRMSINGEFRGTVVADRVEIHKEGRVYAELFTPCLLIEAGAMFEGKCNMAERNRPETPPASSTPAEDDSPTEDRLST